MCFWKKVVLGGECLIGCFQVLLGLVYLTASDLLPHHQRFLADSAPLEIPAKSLALLGMRMLGSLFLTLGAMYLVAVYFYYWKGCREMAVIQTVGIYFGWGLILIYTFSAGQLLVAAAAAAVIVLFGLVQFFRRRPDNFKGNFSLYCLLVFLGGIFGQVSKMISVGSKCC
jgi:hypothetical protein